MEVYNGGDELSPTFGKICGKIAPPPIISSGSQLLIKFVSDYETHGAGFSVRYEVFKTGEPRSTESESESESRSRGQRQEDLYKILMITQKRIYDIMMGYGG